MDIQLTNLPESRVSLKLQLTPDEVHQALERTYRQLAQRLKVPGFRKGKAPLPVVERMVGPETFLHEATEDAVRWAYRKAVDEKQLAPIEEAQIETGKDGHEHLHEGEAFEVQATVTVSPEVQLPDYYQIHLEREPIEVSDDDVTALLQNLRERNAPLEPVARPAQVGDTVIMNIVGKVGGEEAVNEENAEYELRDEELEGDDPAFPGLSKELLNLGPGDIREVTLQLPLDYRIDELAGKTMFLRILVKEIKRKALPELNDEFAPTVSEFQTLEELRDALRKNLELEQKLDTEEKLVEEAVTALASEAQVDIPTILIEDEIDRMLDDLKRAMERRQLRFEQYLEANNKSEEDMREEMREQAVKNVRSNLALNQLADAEGIEVPDREVESALDELLAASSIADTERRRMRSSRAVRSNLRSRLRRQRAMRRLVEIVTGEEVPEEAAEAIAAEEAPAPEDAEETASVSG